MNTPNKITLSRILLLPVIIFFYLASFIPYGKLVSAIIFVIACLTDFVDGHVARKYNQVTTLGKFFDTIADKILITTGLILISSAPVIGQLPIVYPSWAGVICVIIILAREFIVSALRQLAATRGIVLAADMGGKIKATIQYVSVSLYMFYAFFISEFYETINNSNPDLATKLSGGLNFVLLILLVIATFATIYSGASYLIRNKNVFIDEKVPENFRSESEKIEENSSEETEEIIEDTEEIVEENSTKKDKEN